MRLLILLCLVTTTLSAQITLQLEQGATFSEELNYRPIGISLNYQAATWKGFDFSVGLAFDQVALETDLPLVDGAVTCHNGSFFCNFDGAAVKSRESRLFLPLGVSRRAGRFTYGLEIRPGWRVHDAIDFTFPVLFSDLPGETRTVTTRYGEGVERTRMFQDAGEYIVSAPRFRVQWGLNTTYDISENISLGLSYRYEGSINNEVEVSLNGDFSVLPQEPTTDPVYFRGESRVHYLLVIWGWRF